MALGALPLPPYIAGKRAPTRRTRPTIRPSMPVNPAPWRRRPPAALLGCLAGSDRRRRDRTGPCHPAWSGPGPSCRSRRTTPPIIACMRKSAPSIPRRPHGSMPYAPAAGGSSRSAPRRCGCWKAQRIPTARSAVRRRHRDLHHARLPLPRGRRARDELPSAALHPVHAGERFRGLETMRAAYAHAVRDGYTASILRGCEPAVSDKTRDPRPIDRAYDTGD